PPNIPLVLDVLPPYVDPCPYQEGELNAPRLRLSTTDIEIGQQIVICVEGFASGAGTVLTLLRPDGTAREYPIDIDTFGMGRLSWVAMPDNPPGEYLVTARQGEASAQGRFTLHLAGEPHIHILTPGVQVGTPIRVLLTGFEPWAQLYLYRAAPCPDDPTRPCHLFLTTIPLPPLEPDGQGIVELATVPDDPPGEYSLTSDNVALDHLAGDTFSLLP
ncbi:MAG: hypothetical protein D6775_06280, partial [Caldilineae bacterium]